MTVGPWRLDPELRQLSRDGETQRLEPKVQQLLLLLAECPGRAVPKERVVDALWPDTVVAEDTLARVVSKLRRALGDSSRDPEYIETIPRHGYRLLTPAGPAAKTAEPSASTRHRARRWFAAAAALVAATVAAALLVQLRPASTPNSAEALVRRADDLYSNITRVDNASAAELYERALELEPTHSGALAGLANTRVQRAFRGESTTWRDAHVSAAVADGVTSAAAARAHLERASTLAWRAHEVAPDDPRVLKALGFVSSALGDRNAAKQWYRRAVALDPEAWASLINLRELTEAEGDEDAAIALFTQAYSAMDRLYDEQPQRVGQWQSELGVLIGDKPARRGRDAEAERWYRRVLQIEPSHREATIRLVALLERQGKREEARARCDTLEEGLGPVPECGDTLAR